MTATERSRTGLPYEPGESPMKAPVTTLEAVESFAPERIVPIGQLADRLGLRRTKLRLFERVHGLKEIRFDPDLGLFDVVLPAARRITADPLVRDRLKYVVYAHTTQAVAPPTSAPPRRSRTASGWPVSRPSPSASRTAPAASRPWTPPRNCSGRRVDPATALW